MAADFDDDGWPDLYLGVWGGPNRLFYHDGKGGYTDGTTNEIADPGKAFGAAIGDIDNDGDIDIAQPSGGGDQVASGTYIYRLELLDRGFRETRSMTLVR